MNRSVVRKWLYNTQLKPTRLIPSKPYRLTFEIEKIVQKRNMTTRRSFFPATEPYDVGTLQVSDIHTLHYEQSGNPNGKPVLVLHGGPGGGCEPFYRQYFDSNVYRIIMFDQRGAGKSTPPANLEDNTTWHLVSDIEVLREKMGVDRWVVWGGSWGSTLALAYAQKHVERVKALILRGIFTLRRKELLWFYQEGASFMFPEAWEGFVAPIPEAERGDLMSAYHRRLTNDKDPETQLKCATAWSVWEMATSRLFVDPKNIARAAEDPGFSLRFARIECHYFVNAGFFEYDGQLIQEANKILEKNKIPGVIVQGRYDMVCPAYSAWDLHKQWPTAEIEVIPDAGHSCKEEGIIDALVRAGEKYQNL